MQIAQRALVRLDREQHNSGAAAANTMLAAKTRATANRVDRTVKPAAAVSSKIPPPRNWSLAPGARAPASLPGPARTQAESPDRADLSKRPPSPI